MAGFWQNLLSSVRGGSAVFTPRVTYMGTSELAAFLDPSKLTAAQMWETQPHFRTVVTFLARNIAQLGLHSFERDGETDRRRDRDSVLAQTLRDVDGHTTTFELVFALVGDLALYDRAYWWAAPSSEMPSGWMIRRLPPTWVEPVMANPWEVREYRVYIRPDGTPDIVEPDHILAFPGYHPGRMFGFSPTVDALRETLQEQVEAAKYRAQVWKRGGRVSSVLERPIGAPQWSDAAREAFREDWYAKYTGSGSMAGGTPILEDGMSLRRIDFSAAEQQFVEAAKLSLQTVAAAFHVNPTMIGQNEGATYSNVREFRKMLYGDTLGPLVAQIEGRINSFLVPRMGLDRGRFYVEFNIEEKLQGNFEEQSSALQTSTGAPWMTRNEARALRNLPAVEGGDALVTPLNVLIGGQASPADSGSQNRRSVLPAGKARTALVKARAPETYEEQAKRVLGDFFARQGQAVRSRLGAGREDWWDGERWDGELTSTVAGLYLLTATAAGRETLAALGIEPDEYDEPRTEAFLLEAARRSAESINETTQTAVAQAVESVDPDDEDAPSSPVEAAGSVFEIAESSRAAEVAVTVAAFASGFGTVEAARQQAPQATKTWRTTSTNPRPSHAQLNGVTVGIDEDFPNGLPWPGAAGDPDETSGCRCAVEISIP